MNFTALFLLAAIAADFGPLLAVGLPESYASSGQDAGTALLWLHGFADAVERGNLWPRWLMEGNRGFGSPAFLFYPPGAYWAATGLQRATGLTDAGALVAAALLWRAGATTAAYAWLRTFATRQAALASAALLSLQTYNMLVNPLVRFAFAEIAGTCLMLVVLRASSSRRKLLWTPLAFAALVLTHLPTAVLAGGALPTWTLITGRTLREALRDAGKVLLACLMGAGVAGAYLVPALALLPEINVEGWSTGGLTTWSGHFLFDALGPSKAPVQYWLMNAGLAAMLACGVAVAFCGWRQVPPFADRRFTTAAVGLAVLCLLMTRLSWPVWALLPILQRVQFPWRLMPYATAIWAVLIAVRLDSLNRAGVRGGDRMVASFALLFALAALWIPFSAITAGMPSLARYEWTRLQFPQPGPPPLPAGNPPEYAPRAAAEAGWRADDPATDVILDEKLSRSRAAASSLRVTIDSTTSLHILGSLDQPAEILLPQFAFPGWTVSGTSPEAKLLADPESGLMRLVLLAGSIDLAVMRTATGPERLGWVVSAASVLLWLSLGLSMRGAGRLRKLRLAAGD